jgi:hypothetical protein
MVASNRFSIGALLYCLVSLAIFLSVAFTGAAWIIYLVTIAPLYLGTLLYCWSLYLEYPTRSIGIDRTAGWAVIGSQIFTLLCSPADCRGWHQGNACRALLQTQIFRRSPLPTICLYLL